MKDTPRSNSRPKSGVVPTNSMNSAAEQMAFDRTGNLLVVDCQNNCVRMINTNKIISTFAGIGCSCIGPGFSGDGGAATNAHLSIPTGLAVDAADEVAARLQALRHGERNSLPLA